MSESFGSSDPLASLGATPSSKARPGKRTRIVLAERRSARRVVRTLADVEEQTSVGEVLVRQLVKAQLVLALRLGLLVALAIGLIPLALAVVPQLRAMSVLGIPVYWLVAGVAVYPFFYLVARVYTRAAERNEQDFTEMVET